MPDPKQQIDAYIAEVWKERKPGDTPEVLLQRVKDRMAQPPADPTPFFLQQREQAGKTIYDDPHQVPDEEPSSFLGGFFKSLNQQAGETAQNGLLNRAAHPEDTADLASLLIPSGVSTAVNAASKYIPKALVTGGRALKELGREYYSMIPGLSGKTMDALGRVLGSDVTDLARGTTTETRAAEAAKAASAVKPSPNAGGRLVTNPPPSTSLEEELMKTIEGKIAPPSAELPPPPTITDPVSRKGFYSSGTPSASAEEAAQAVSATPRSRLVNPNSANRGGKLVAGKPTPTLEDELVAELSAPEKAQGGTLPPQPELTATGRPSVSAERQVDIETAAKQGDKSRLVNPNSANKGGKLVPASAPEKSLEDELASMLESSSSPSAVELPPEPGITDASTSRQSGKFKKSSRQAGHYDSGNPGTPRHIHVEDHTPEPLVEELMAEPSSAPSAPASKASSTPTITEEPRGKTLEEALMDVEKNPRAIPESLDTTDWTPQDWQHARDMWGSRNVSRMTGRTADEVQRLAPGKRGRPIYVEQIMREDEARKKFEWE